MSENPLWDFALAVYGRPGVPAACLDLQDRLGQDVNLLLFAAWAGMACNADLPAEELARIDSAIAPWRDEVVRPLRAVRRRAKGGDDALYKRLKAAELEAERVQQDRLFALSGLTPAPGGGVALAAVNLYRLVPEGDPAVMGLLAALATPPEP
ncbi:TIGR02444 family protein [Azospirillum formosense]|uniref:TIGR02444 family protein n=1 Tax=Azospirillum formosense TaxID=861533 RepID=A0ABX2L2Z1_9PROT|nr:TIGR02444 family protein [Azospirillum formosense]MBY3752555.1 TIGR02444 family protein [Azospirillum formosense]NUB20476.1 TIGR02444 family protein [Azospirillum formosense]